MDTWGTTKRRVRGRLVVTRAGEGFVSRSPVEARDTLVVDAILLVMSFMKTCETEDLDSKVEGGVILGGSGILQDGRKCLQGQFLAHR